MIGPIRFDQIEALVLPKPGIYEIHTRAGVPLKVGVGADIQCRLKDHRASRQSGLRVKAGGNRLSPNDVESKKSILAKHLYYDSSIAPGYDLKTEAGRRAFLLKECRIVFELTQSLQQAQGLETLRERTGIFRYVGLVITR